MPPSLPRRSVETQYPHPLYIFVFESQTNGGSGKKNGWAAIPSVSSRLSVLLPSCLPYAFRGQSWSPGANTIPSVLCWFRKSLVCFFLSLVQTRSHLCHVVFVSMCYSHLVCSTHLVDRTWRPRASTILSVPCRLVQ